MCRLLTMLSFDGGWECPEGHSDFSTAMINTHLMAELELESAVFSNVQINLFCCLLRASVQVSHFGGQRMGHFRLPGERNVQPGQMKD